MSRLFGEIAYKNSCVLVGFGLRRSHFVRLAWERRGLIRELLLLGSIGEVFTI